MTSSKAAKRPPIQMIDTEADTLTNLAISVEERLPQVSELLLDEIARATVHSAARIPADVVTMHATVEFTDEASGAARTVQLVFPKNADISAGRISILTPVGAGLIGLREGQSILWPDRDGHQRKLTIVKVTQAAATAT
jgi:regulator of nucleoside diphosphate kinase